MSVGENIKQLRLQNNLTQEELASKIFVTRNAVSKWETNKGIPSIDNLKQLASLFKVSLDQIVNEEDRIIMAMVNTEKIQSFRDVLSSIGIFLTYTTNGILIPYIFLNIDEFNETAINYILLPFIYMLFGLFTVLGDIPRKYFLIGSSLALIPIYVLYDVLLPEYTLGLIGILHYTLFVLSYFLLNLFIKFLYHFEPIKLQKIFMYLAVLITIIYILHTTIASISLYNCVVCSAPWYLEIVVNTILYAIPIAIPTILYFHFKKSTF
ncbi:helix-turn-helix domain-containing protein [Candidatus Xianfuyuplasma coldseepsis]|uniref:Helix-turn-helix transcriptional regulator n=1 Tax=Candidatus Xianfuyuplasma coldseepsis TaxID=2782163 RepID=A0A7L7KNZ1_9MOLU|nr:helix-turn-helix transcriptional regulator [Xianfuyuplasma coldseepsis]QMS84377.1 helix-turn-helix transcriptional regulator [Xianfuyuplasma coldseepsis]